MLSRQERQQTRDEIGLINNEIDQIKGELDQIRDQLNSNWQNLKELREAQRHHEKEARKSYMRHVGYQGGHCDQSIYRIQGENEGLKARKEQLYQRKNELHARKQDLYAKLNPVGAGA